MNVAVPTLQCAGAEISRSVEEVDRAGGHGSARRIGGDGGRERHRLAEGHHRPVIDQVGGQDGADGRRGLGLVDRLAAGQRPGAGQVVGVAAVGGGDACACRPPAQR